MSELSLLTGAGRSDVIPGYVLSPLTLLDYAEAEEEFSRWHVGLVAGGVRHLPGHERERAIQLAAERASTGLFSFGTSAFRQKSLTPAGQRLMLYLSLRNRQPEVTWEKAGELLARDPEKIAAALFELVGLHRSKKVTRPADPRPLSAGDPSSPPSASAESIHPKLPG